MSPKGIKKMEKYYIKADFLKVETMSSDELKEYIEELWAAHCKQNENYEYHDYDWSSYYDQHRTLKDLVVAKRYAEGKVSELENEWRSKYESVQEQISNYLEVAHEALSKAEKLSEQEGVPFYSSISEQWFAPESAGKFREIPELQEEFDELNLSDYYGWEHSAVC